MRLFISRNLDSNSHVAEIARTHNWQLTDISFIQQKPCGEGKSLPPSDYLFFTSPAAVSIFVNTFGTPNRPVCTLGKGTTSALPKEITPVFEGEGTAQEVAQQFAHFAQNKKVLFPIGNQSIGTVQKALQPDQVTEIVIYETISNPASLPIQDVYVFTSPSNVRSFLLSNPPINDEHVIALGQKTAAELNKNGISSILSEDYTPEGIVHTIFSIVGS